MKNLRKRYNFKNFFLSVTLLTAINVGIAYGICRYNGFVGLEGFINVLFTMGIVTAAIGALAYYGSYNSFRDVNYQIAQSVGVGSSSDRREQELKYVNTSINFFLKLACSGALVFLVSLVLSFYL